MKKQQISINLESLQDRMKDTKQIKETIKSLMDVGYEYVEVLHFLNPDAGTTWAQIFEENRMNVCSIHELYEDIEKEPERIARKAKLLGCKYIACGLSRFTIWENEDSLKELADGLNRLGKFFKNQNLQLLYHNHNMEFTKYDNVHTGLQYVFNNTDSDLVGAELDVYWAHLSGVNPIELCQWLGKRVKAIHLKDLGVKGISTPDQYIKMPSVMALGYGNLNLESIVNEADKAGCEWFIVETHTGWLNGDSLYTAEKSYKYLERLCK